MNDVAPDLAGDMRHTWADLAYRILLRKQHGARKALERKLAEHERTETRLAAADAANEHLLREMALRHRTETPAADVRGIFESAFASAPIGMALVDTEGRWLEVNDALCRILGLTREEFKATTLHVVAHPEDLNRDEHSLR